MVCAPGWNSSTLMQSGSSPIHILGSSWKSLVFLRFAAQNFLQPGTYRFRTNTIGQPDLFVRGATDRPLLVGIVDCDQVYKTLRLFTYMLLTGASFGVLVDGESIRYAKISRRDTLLSAPVSSWWALGCVLQLARDEPQQSIGDNSLSLAKLAPRDSHVVDSVKSIATQHRPSHAGAIIHGMENLSFGDLEDVSCKWPRDAKSSVVSAKYKQQPVVLKVRDLTTPWLLDVETNLRKVITEVDAYKTLHKLQGVQIPRLVSWGFLCGTMFAYVMTSDEDIEAAVAPAYEALAKIHARGLIHGDLKPLKILVRRGSRSSQSSWVTIIGYSSASYVGPKEIHVAAGREMAKLQQCFEEGQLGANLQGDDESSPKTDEASEASEMLSR
ncbi:hypothetical protein SELMODRAFT_409109 [Selaginella moellendorffii]|uniref:Protein kinase domain-containing protein n=1 Tax=Selaginella moellendorffii TaxID=88036 RepID=D8RAE1_SELML|nr:hypothetical protein SELMODRAFT_409109 [Selaginella moellendorffii]